nr:MAG TPA: hypothetical protein [Caudoviricetes sp.]
MLVTHNGIMVVILKMEKVNLLISVFLILIMIFI